MLRNHGWLLWTCVSVLTACTEPSAPTRETLLGEAASSLGTSQRGAITIALNMRPKTAANVTFVFDGTRKFTLDDDNDPSLPSTQTFDKLKAGAYTVRQ